MPKSRVDNPHLLVRLRIAPDPGERHVGPSDERARRLQLGAHDLRDRRLRGDCDGARRLARGGSGGVAERPLPARMGLNTALHRAAPVAKAARRAQAGRPAGGGGSVPQPNRARGRRAPVAAARHRCRARHRDDEGDGRRLHDEDWCRARRRVRRTARGAGPHEREECAAACGVEAEAIARVGREFASTRPALLRLGVPAARGRAGRLSTIASLPALTGAWKYRNAVSIASAAESNEQRAGGNARESPQRSVSCVP